MKRLDIPKETFIGGYFIGEEMADRMKDFFHANSQQIKPTKMPSNIKKCVEFSICPKENIFQPIWSYQRALGKVIQNYLDDYGLKEWQFDINERYNVQHYEKGEGFFPFHCERAHNTPPQCLRSLVFMTYLNDVDDGGTEFLHQNCEVKARKGLTLIWPADWTHTHRGIISKTKEKTIITGWIELLKPFKK